MRIRPEVADALASRPAVDHQPRILLVQRHRQHRIRLVVAVADVEPRVEFLDPVVFQLQRLDFGVHHRPLDAARGHHHLAGARRQARRCRRSRTSAGCAGSWPYRRRSPGRADPGTGRRPARRESTRGQAGTSLDRARIPGYCRRQTAPMNYRRVMRIPSLRKVAAPLAGVDIGTGRMRRRGERTAHRRGGPLLDHRERHPGAQDDRPAPAAGSVTTSRNISTNPEVATGYRKDMTAVRTAHYAVVTANPLATQAACVVLQRRRNRRRRARHGAGGAGPGGAAVLRHRRRRVPAVLRRCRGLGTGLRRPRGRRPKAATENYLRWISDADRTEPKPDARASGPVHRRARHPAAAAGRPHRARQDRVA